MITAIQRVMSRKLCRDLETERLNTRFFSLSTYLYAGYSVKLENYVLNLDELWQKTDLFFVIFANILLRFRFEVQFERNIFIFLGEASYFFFLNDRRFNVFRNI